MKITDKPARVKDISNAFKCLSQARDESQKIDFNADEGAFGWQIMAILMSYPDEIIKAIYYINREEEDLDNLYDTSDMADIRELVTKLIEVNRENLKKGGIFSSTNQNETSEKTETTKTEE